MTYHWLLITALSIAFTVTYSRYRRTRKQMWLWVALVAMMGEVEVRKEEARRGQ